MLSAFIEWVFKGFWQRFQLKGRFSGQWLDTWKFMISFLYRQARVTNKEIFKESNNLLSLYSKDFTKDLKSELRTFAHKASRGDKRDQSNYILGWYVLESQYSASFPQFYIALFLRRNSGYCAKFWDMFYQPQIDLKEIKKDCLIYPFFSLRTRRQS